MTEEEILVALRLLNQARFVAGVEGASAAVGELGLATEEAGLAMTRTNRRGFLMNQTLFTMRRLLYGVSLGLIAGGVAAFKWGFQFNSTMQSARLALSRMGLQGQALNAELDQLFQMAKLSPFNFQDMTQAFRSLYFGVHNLGLPTKQINDLMQALMDTLTMTGKSTPANLNRVSVALQHMAFAGHVTSQILTQLYRDGIPTYRVLREEFHLTADQIHNIGALGMPTLTFLRGYIDWAKRAKDVHGAARAASLHTFSGLFQNFRDSMSQIMGAVEKGFFARSNALLIQITNFFSRTSDAVKRSHNATEVLSAMFPQLMPFFTVLIQDLHLFWVAFSQIIYGITHSKMLWLGLYTGLQLIHGVLILVNPLLGGMQYWLDILIPLWVIYKGVQIAAAFATGALTFAEVAQTAALKDLSFMQFIFNVYTGRYNIISKIAAAMTWLYTAAVYALYVAEFRATAMTEALTAASVGLRLAAAQGFLAMTFAAAPFLAILIAIAAEIYLIIRYWDQIRGFVHGVTHPSGDHPRSFWSRAGNWAAGAAVNSAAATVLGPAAGLIPGMAGGGNVVQSGWSMVGEHGPEMLYQPKGAKVVPLTSPEGGWGGVLQLHGVINMDGKKVGDGVFRARAVQAAFR